MYFNIKCMGKLPGLTNEFEGSLVFETGEFERPKFDCIVSTHEILVLTAHAQSHSFIMHVQLASDASCLVFGLSIYPLTEVILVQNDNKIIPAHPSIIPGYNTLWLWQEKDRICVEYT